MADIPNIYPDSQDNVATNDTQHEGQGPILHPRTRDVTISINYQFISESQLNTETPTNSTLLQMRGFAPLRGNGMVSDSDREENDGRLVLRFNSIPIRTSQDTLNTFISAATDLAIRRLRELKMSSRGITDEAFNRLPIATKEFAQARGDSSCGICLEKFEYRSENEKIIYNTSDDCSDDSERYCDAREFIPSPIKEDAAPKNDHSDNLDTENDNFHLHEPIQLPCGHIFGRQCIKRWVTNENTCPYCRQVISEETISLRNQPFDSNDEIFQRIRHLVYQPTPVHSEIVERYHDDTHESNFSQHHHEGLNVGILDPPTNQVEMSYVSDHYSHDHMASAIDLSAITRRDTSDGITRDHGDHLVGSMPSWNQDVDTTLISGNDRTVLDSRPILDTHHGISRQRSFEPGTLNSIREPGSAGSVGHTSRDMATNYYSGRNFPSNLISGDYHASIQTGNASRTTGNGNNVENMHNLLSANIHEIQVTTPDPQDIHVTTSNPQDIAITRLDSRRIRITTPDPHLVHITTQGPHYVQVRSPSIRRTSNAENGNGRTPTPIIPPMRGPSPQTLQQIHQQALQIRALLQRQHGSMSQSAGSNEFVRFGDGAINYSEHSDDGLFSSGVASYRHPNGEVSTFNIESAHELPFPDDPNP